MSELELQVLVIELFEDLSLGLGRGGPIELHQLPAGLDLLELVHLGETGLEVGEQLLLGRAEGLSTQTPETVHEVHVVVQVRAWHQICYSRISRGIGICQKVPLEGPTFLVV